MLTLLPLPASLAFAASLRCLSGSGKPETALSCPLTPLPPQVKAHKTHLVARSEYFRSMFRKGAMRESETCEVR